MADRCASCPNRTSKCVPAEPARRSCKLVVVGETPSRDDIHENRPFVSAGGRMLLRLLNQHGIRRADVHWTNATLCDVGSDPKALASAAKACRNRLHEELRQASAPVIMPVGAQALASVLGTNRKLQLQKWRGSISEIKLTETSTSTLVAPTLHPVFVRRMPHWEPILRLDVARAVRLISDGFTPPELAPHRKLIVPRDADALCAAHAALKGDAISFDVETLGLGPTETPLVCYGLSDGTTTIVIPWSRKRDGAEPFWRDGGKLAAELTSEVLASRICVTHNGRAFDFIVAKRYGINIAQWDDTLLMSHATAGHLPKNLAHVVTQYVDVPPWKQLEDRTADLERLWTYNGRDCLYTVLAYLAKRQELS